MNQKDLIKNMKDLDEEFSNLYPEFQLKCVIIGGGALIIKDLIPRMTTDIDVINSMDIAGDLLPLFGFSNKAIVYESNLPYHYEDRLEKVNIHTKSISYYTPSTEDLIVSKIYASREKDIEDLVKIKQSGSYDHQKLKQAIEDAKLSSLNEYRYYEMVDLYHRYFSEEDQ